MPPCAWTPVLRRILVFSVFFAAQVSAQSLTEVVDIHRSYNGAIHDHLQGLVANEGAPSYQYEGVHFKAWKYAGAGRLPLYRCQYWPTVQNTAWAGPHHFLTTAPDCEMGIAPQQVLGYISSSQEPGTVPLTRCYWQPGGDHIATVYPNECGPAGFIIEGSGGYVPAPGPKLTLDKTTLVHGAYIGVVLTGGSTVTSGNWIGVFPVGSPDNSAPLQTSVNTTSISVGNAPWYGGGAYTYPNWGTGQFEFRYYLGGGFTVAARSPPFTVNALPNAPMVNCLNIMRPNLQHGYVVLFTLQNGLTASTGNWLGLYPVGASDTAYLARQDTGSSATHNWYLPLTASMGSGQFEVRYFSQSNVFMAKTAPFDIKPPPVIATSTTAILPGQTITATLTGGTAAAGSWLALYRVGAPNDDSPFAKVVIGSASYSWPVTISPAWGGGQLEFRYFISTTAANQPYVTTYWESGKSAPFTVVTATTPSLTTNVSSVVSGGAITVSLVNGSTSTLGNWLGIYRVGAPNSVIDLKDSISAGGASVNWTVAVQESWGPGQFEARYFTGGGYTLAASSAAFSVTPAPSLTVDKPFVQTGTVFNVTLSNGTAAAGSWIGIYRVGAPNDTSYVSKMATATGSLSWAMGPEVSWGTGQFEARYFVGSGYSLNVKSAPFLVVAAVPVIALSTLGTQSGGTVTGTLSNGLTTPQNWMGLYRVSAPNDASYVANISVSGATYAWAVPVTADWGAGQFEFRYYINGNYTLAAKSAPFSVNSSIAALKNGLSAKAILANGITSTTGNQLAIAKVGAPDTSKLSTIPADGVAKTWEVPITWGAGKYEFRYYLAGSSTVSARSASLDFQTQSPTLTLAELSTDVGGTMTVELANGATGTGHSIALARVGTADSTTPLAQSPVSTVATSWAATLQSSWGPGQYEFRYRLSGSTAVVARSFAFAVVSVPTATVGALEAGRSPANATVTSSGTARTTIPLWTPPGIGAAHVSLSLDYDSSAGNGVIGMGWSLSGLSSITRCPKTFASNGQVRGVFMTSSDRFCLDGQQLMLVSGVYGAAGSVYATESETFARVQANGVQGNGPANFTVTTKNGVILTYGADNGVAPAITGGSTIRSWLLTQVADRIGNSVRYIYDNTTQAKPLLSRIEYPFSATGAGPANVVTFTYALRPTTEGVSGFSAGGFVEEKHLLRSIVTTTSTGAELRRYTLTHDQGASSKRSRLTSIQECAGARCLPATTFTYSTGATGLATTQTNGPAKALSFLQLTQADFNGDGKTDLVFVSGDHFDANLANAYRTYSARFSTGSSFSADLPLNGIVTPYYTGLPGGHAIVTGAFSGASKAELVMPSLVNGTSTLHLVRYDGTQFVSTNLGIAAPDVGSPSPKVWAAADLDGNGMTDLIWGTNQHSGVSIGQVYGQLNTTTGGVVSFGPLQLIATLGAGEYLGGIGGGLSPIRDADFNRDGMADLVVAADTTTTGTTRYIFLRSEGASGGTLLPLTQIANVSNPNLAPLPLADWNGDGCTDYVRGAVISFSDCLGAFPTTGALTTSTASAVSPFFVDYDGDGRTDFLYKQSASATTFSVIRSTGTGAAAPVATSIAAPTCGTWKPFFFDMNGDGLSDLGSYCYTANVATPLPSVNLHNTDGAAPAADLMLQLRDGYGNTQTFSYGSIAGGASYTKGTGAVFPTQDVQSPTIVVKALTSSDGIGGTYQLSYSYEEARAHLHGRGSLGFRKRTVLDSRNGVTTAEIYRQDYPHIGTLASVVVSTRSETLLTKNFTRDSQTLGSGLELRRFSFVQSAETLQNEIANNGSAKSGVVKRETTTWAYNDGYGNPTNITTTTTDLDSVAPTSPYAGQSWVSTSTFSYANDTNTWCLGLPSSLSETRSTPTEASTRTQAWSVDAVKCRATAIVNQLAPLALQTTTTLGFDACGNVNSSSVVGHTSTGAEMPARVSSSVSETGCRFPASVTNAAGETSSTVYNALGAPLSSTGANGLITQWQYDGLGRVKLETRPDGTTVATDYDSTLCAAYGSGLRLGVLETVRSSAGRRIGTRLTCHDSLERPRLKAAVNPRGIGLTNIELVTYDALGRVVRRDHPHQPGGPSGINGYETYAYDVLGRELNRKLFQSNGTLAATTTTTYLGLTTKVVNPRGFEHTSISDVMGQTRRLVEPAPGTSAQYDHDEWGNLKRVVDPNGRANSFDYNLLGHRVKAIDVNRGTVIYEVNSLGEVTKQYDLGQPASSMSFTYDALGRRRTRVEPEGTSTWTYGSNAALKNVGRLVSVSGPGYSESYTYDSLARLAKKSISMGQVYDYLYSYNTSGFLDTLQYPQSPLPTPQSLSIRHLYSEGAVAQLNNVTSGVVPLWRLEAVNDYGSATSESISAVVVSHSYEAHTNRIQWLQAGTGGSSANRLNTNLLWDSNGNLSSRQDWVAGGTVQDFTNDPLDRLTTVRLNGTVTESYGYDVAGNVTSRSGVGTYAYGDPAHPDAVTAAGSSGFSYDAHGNMIQRNGQAQTWASYDLPLVLRGSGQSTTFSYGPDRQLYRQVATYPQGTETISFIGGLLQRVTPAGSASEEWRHTIATPAGSSLLLVRSATDSRWYETISDHLGGTALVIDDATQEPLWTGSYSSFGQRTGPNWSGQPSSTTMASVAATTHEGFSGHNQLDNLGLIHMGGRVYDPSIGRFLSVDGALSLKPQSMNAYSYVSNRPLSLVDPTGFSEEGLPGSGSSDGDEWGAGGNPGGYVTFTPGNGLTTVDTITITGFRERAAAATTDWFGAVTNFFAGWFGNTYQDGAWGISGYDRSNISRDRYYSPGYRQGWNAREAWSIAQQFISGPNPWEASCDLRICPTTGMLPIAGKGFILYRGLKASRSGDPIRNAQFEAAKHGEAIPRGGLMTASSHSLNRDGRGTDSIFTSWTTDKDLAAVFAGQKGVILTREFKPWEVFRTDLAPAVEAEFLASGRITGAHVTMMTRPSYISSVLRLEKRIDPIEWLWDIEP